MPINKLKIKQPTCPWWFLFTFDNPLRKLYQDPDKILSPYIKSGDTAVDLGCGMGYFSIPLAALVGTHGKVISVDLQEEMLAGLRRRAERAGLLERISTHRSAQNQIGLSEGADFILAFWMLHEVHNSRSFLEQIHVMLKPGGRLLIAEPYLHVSKARFLKIKSEVQESGLRILPLPKIGFSRSLLAVKED